MMNANKKIKIGIIDDAKIVLKGWENSFRGHKDIELLFMAANKQSFWEKCAQHYKELDVLIMDKSIDGKTQFDDFDYIRKTIERFPNLKIIVYTWDYYSGHIEYLRDMGVRAYLPNKADEKEMFCAVRRVAKGESYFPKNNKTKEADKQDYFGKGNSFDLEIIRLTAALNPAENKVAAYLAHDFLKKQIAERLNVSVKTIEKHITGIYHKLGIIHGQTHTRSSFNLKYGAFFRQKYPNVK